MIVCIGTNVAIQALARGHAYFPILDAWVQGQFTWAVSAPILLEYEEVITRMSGTDRWRRLSRLMDLAEMTSGNLLRVTPSFQFQVIPNDPEDNMFVDCAIVANAEHLITQDRHFLPWLMRAIFQSQFLLKSSSRFTSSS